MRRRNRTVFLAFDNKLHHRLALAPRMSQEMKKPRFGKLAVNPLQGVGSGNNTWTLINRDQGEHSICQYLEDKICRQVRPKPYPLAGFWDREFVLSAEVKLRDSSQKPMPHGVRRFCGALRP